MMIQLANARSAGCESGMRQRGSFDENQDVLIITKMIDRLDEGRLSRRRAPACPLPACVLPRDLIDETRNIIPQRRVSLGRQYAPSSSLRPKMKGPFHTCLGIFTTEGHSNRSNPHARGEPAILRPYQSSSKQKRQKRHARYPRAKRRKQNSQSAETPRSVSNSTFHTTCNPAHRTDTLLIDDPQPLPDLDLLPRLSHKSEPFRRFEDKDDRASQLESSHLLSCCQRLTTKERRRLGVHGLSKSMGWVLRVSFIGPQVLHRGNR